MQCERSRWVQCDCNYVNNNLSNANSWYLHSCKWFSGKFKFFLWHLLEQSVTVFVKKSPNVLNIPLSKINSSCLQIILACLNTILNLANVLIILNWQTWQTVSCEDSNELSSQGKLESMQAESVIQVMTYSRNWSLINQDIIYYVLSPNVSLVLVIINLMNLSPITSSKW